MKAKKSLGQNFLKSVKALSQMVEAAAIGKKDTVLEIGPGKGALTKKLLETGAHVIAIEKDRELIPLLSELFAHELAAGTLVLVEGDILTYGIRNLLGDQEYKLVANIPYYITGAIIRQFLESAHPPQSMTLLVQKEVAERIVARDKKESILSLSVKAYGVPKIVAKVSKRYFTPEPAVDSAIIHIADISKKHFSGAQEQEFFAVVKAAFAQKRKTLVKNLSLYTRRTDIAAILETLGIEPKARPEDVSLSEYLQLASFLSTRYNLKTEN